MDACEPARAPCHLHQHRTARFARNPAVVLAGAVFDRRHHRGIARRGACRAVAAVADRAAETDLPILVELADSEEKIKLLLPYLEESVREGMITMEQSLSEMVRSGKIERDTALAHCFRSEDLRRYLQE